MSMIMKFTCTKVICNSIITLFMLPKECLVEQSASCKSILHFSRTNV
jgi:hypothetical protein